MESDLRLSAGDRVRVLTGPYMNKEGEVDLVFSTDTSYGPYAIAWVRLENGRIEGFKPQRLQLVRRSDSASRNASL
jgi:hypothetical protein